MGEKVQACSAKLADLSNEELDRSARREQVERCAARPVT